MTNREHSLYTPLTRTPLIDSVASVGTAGRVYMVCASRRIADRFNAQWFLACVCYTRKWRSTYVWLYFCKRAQQIKQHNQS